MKSGSDCTRHDDQPPSQLLPDSEKVVSKAGQTAVYNTGMLRLAEKDIGAAEPAMMQLAFTLESYVTPSVTVIGVGLDADFKI